MDGVAAARPGGFSHWPGTGIRRTESSAVGRQGSRRPGLSMSMIILTADPVRVPGRGGLLGRRSCPSASQRAGGPATRAARGACGVPGAAGPGAGRSRQRHRWSIDAAPATAMEHRCRCPGPAPGHRRGAWCGCGGRVPGGAVAGRPGARTREEPLPRNTGPAPGGSMRIRPGHLRFMIYQTRSSRHSGLLIAVLGTFA